MVMHLLLIFIAFVVAYTLFVAVFYGLSKIFFDKIETDDETLPRPARKRDAVRTQSYARNRKHVLQKI